jgi:hypothetical protein
MNNKIANIFMLFLGATAGSLVTWKYAKTKYERIAQEEIDSVKEVFRRQANGIEQHTEDKCEEETEDEVEEEPGDEELREYHDIANRYSNVNYSNVKNEQKGGGATMIEKPYVIGPDEFGELDGYETSSLTYYADGVLEDDYYVVIEADAVDDMVGLESLEHFGEHEEDTVFVRNEKLKTDFEIQRDLRNYSDTTHESLRNG